MGRKGFFTDATLCIGCKACEVACKQWNQLPDDGFDFTGMSYDNTVQLGASSWRHVAFVERQAPQTQNALDAQRRCGSACGCGDQPESPERESPPEEFAPPITFGPMEVDADGNGSSTPQLSWLMVSDVCKHCRSAGCLEACPTGAIVRTEFDSVYVQPDVCNGCGYCVTACPFGVIARREDDGRAWKCTLCYDRTKEDLDPACAKACPTASIVYGDLDELTEKARRRVGELHARGIHSAYLYGADEQTQPGTGGLNAFFLLTDRPEVYNLPPAPVTPTKRNGDAWRALGAAAAGLALASLGAVLWARGGER